MQQYENATAADRQKAVDSAHSAFPLYSALPAVRKAEFLEAIAREIMDLGDALIECCVKESGLPAGRITGERGRTCGQLQLFARVLKEGSWVDARIDTALPDRAPAPRPDIRRMLIPTGPVAVFGASNFPLAFSTAGGDTASALAAGCPVVIKAHPSQPGTHQMVASAILRAAAGTGMPDGVFSALFLSNEDALALVQHPYIQAVGFTGSRKAGMALLRAAQERPQPIPLFAEMSAVNPVVILEGALRDQGEKIAQGLAGSVTLGVGQFCTNPGLVLLVESPGASAFLDLFAGRFRATLPGPMLNTGICKAYREGVQRLQAAPAVKEIARSAQAAGDDGREGQPFAFVVGAGDFLDSPGLADEVFGPVTLFVRCADNAQLIRVLESLEGQLTATIHATSQDKALLAPLTVLLTQKAGRVIYGGFPTGVEVSDAMQHGGPFPSTTDPRSTSVGTAAILRFVRPVAYQDFPADFLPDALKDDNPLGIMRLVNGELTR
jgi:alpha-ketoglutaric semialdehyde dehydrogenase